MRPKKILEPIFISHGYIKPKTKVRAKRSETPKLLKTYCEKKI